MIADTLREGGFQAYLVGGCLRDLLIKRKPTDWDVATDATPDEIQKIFEDSVYENQFGTVGVKTESLDPALRVIEATTFRIEGKYTDRRHPDEVRFAKTIEEDLARRDFTMNAIAYELLGSKKIVDPYGGEKDIKAKIIRAVGEPEKRFSEDALRLMRAVRFSAQLGFKLEEKTASALKAQAELISEIAEERIRDEFSKLLMTEKAADGIRALQEFKILKRVLPELAEGVGVGQNKHHIYTVFEHNVRALEYAAEKNFSLEVRLASLLHDVAKPRTKKGEGPDSTFYGHQIVGAKMAKKILERLRFSNDIIARVILLIREHMFVYDPEAVTLKGVRRLVARVGSDNIDDLFRLREADRIGSGVPKAQPYRLRYLKAMIEKVKSDPVSARMLAVNGNELMKELGIEPGPKVGAILAVLLEEVLDEPKKNKKPELLARAKELHRMTDGELAKLRETARKSAEEAQERIDAEIKKKYFV